MLIFACPVKFVFIFNRGSSSRMGRILTTQYDLLTYGASIHALSISRINPPKFGGRLKFEPAKGGCTT